MSEILCSKIQFKYSYELCLTNVLHISSNLFHRIQRQWCSRYVTARRRSVRTHSHAPLFLPNVRSGHRIYATRTGAHIPVHSQRNAQLLRGLLQYGSHNIPETDAFLTTITRVITSGEQVCRQPVRRSKAKGFSRHSSHQ